jgi:lysozyme
MTVALTIDGGCRSAQTVPSVDRLPSPELVSPTRAVIPMGFDLRPLSSKGLKLTESSEGWYPYRYNDAARYCTIGYGHLIKKSPCDGTEPGEFLHPLSEQKGEDLLASDMASSRYTVIIAVEVDLTNGQFAALSDFVFNVGTSNFMRSTLLKAVNAEEEDRISGQFRRWTLAGGKTWPGLVKRREREIALFYEGRPASRAAPPPGEDLSPIDILDDAHSR